MRRQRAVKIVSTIGPASSSREMIQRLFEAGADVFRLNFSHGTHEEHAERYRFIRDLEETYGRPVCVMADLQGPKIRVGDFAAGRVELQAGAAFTIDADPALGDEHRVSISNPEILTSLEPGHDLLLDDGKVRLKVIDGAADWVETEVVVGGPLSNHKGLNIPGALLPIAALTPKDRKDLTFALDLGADIIALSFVQRPDDVAEAKKLIQGRAAVLVKLEKPLAIQHLDEIVDLTDAVMVARGDLGVEAPPEDVPSLQKKIIQVSRNAGKPVIVATQMLESMIGSPTPTRAEASDVATAVFDGADAVMLSAETAAGKYPIEAVSIMDRIIQRAQSDPNYQLYVNRDRRQSSGSAADAITEAAGMVARTIQAAAIVTFTRTGSTTLRASRMRPSAPILGLTPELKTARRLALAWGVHSVHSQEIAEFADMVTYAAGVAKAQEFAVPGQRLVVTAGVPFGTPGSTNVLRIVWVD
jgi:pyruvate kinase